MLSSSLIIAFSSTFSVNPIPLQTGHAPNGLLNEKVLGSSSSIPIPWSGQASFVENILSLLSSPVPSCASTRPSPSLMASSTASEILPCCPSLITILSMTISILCLLFFSSLISSSLIWYSSPSILTLVKPSRLILSMSFSCWPFLPLTTGARRISLVPSSYSIKASTIWSTL